jgi:hypothetical protein
MGELSALTEPTGPDVPETLGGLLENERRLDPVATADALTSGRRCSDRVESPPLRCLGVDCVL